MCVCVCVWLETGKAAAAMLTMQRDLARWRGLAEDSAAAADEARMELEAVKVGGAVVWHAWRYTCCLLSHADTK